MGREVERIWGELGKGNHNQYIVWGEIYFKFLKQEINLIPKHPKENETAGLTAYFQFWGKHTVGGCSLFL